jgi:hypothetical protein
MVTIAVGMVAASEQLETDQLENFVMVGELALNGAVRSVSRLRRVRLALAGDSLAKDCYWQETPPGQLGGLRARALLLDAKLPARQIQPALCRELGQLGALPELRVVDAATGEAAWGVEWLPTRVNGRTVINAVNLLCEPVQVRILRGNRTLAATDLLSFGGREQVETLKPMTPVLALPASK